MDWDSGPTSSFSSSMSCTSSMAGSWVISFRLGVGVIFWVSGTDVPQFLRACIADKHVIGEDVIQGNVVGTTVVARPDLYLAKNMPLVR